MAVVALAKPLERWLGVSEPVQKLKTAEFAKRLVVDPK